MSLLVPVRLAIAVLVALGEGCVSANSSAHDDSALLIGALLPFTGAGAAGEDIERALLLGAEQINAAGGINGQEVAIVARDTHGDVERGRDAAEELVREGVVAMLGPEEDDLAIALRQPLVDAGIVMVSGGTTAREASGNGFIRTIPTSDFLGTRIARRLLSDKVNHALIIEDGSTFARSYADAIVEEANAISVVNSRVVLPVNEQFATKSLSALLKSSIDSVVLLLQPQHAAEVAQQISIVSTRSLRFYLSHILRSQALVDNIPPGSLNGAVGISPVLAESAGTFAELFQARWGSEEANQAAYFNYDAFLVVALALQSAAHDGNGTIDHRRLKDYIYKVASGGTRRVAPHDVAAALAAAASGDALDYRGVTGPIDYDEDGELVRPRGTEFWSILGDHVEVTESE